MCERVRIDEAAAELGCSKAKIRERMKRKIWDLGEAIPPSKTGKKQWEFHIYREKLNKHLGKSGGEGIENKS